MRTKNISEHESPNTTKQAAVEKGLDSLLQTSSSESADLDSELEELAKCKEINSSKRQKIYRNYCKEWEIHYKWIKQDAETKRPICIACKQLLINQKTHLARHAGTKKHIDN